MSIVKRSIDAETAQRLIDTAVAKSRELKKKNCIAVTDESGHLKAFHAMDGAPHLSIEIAQNKAWTATSFGSIDSANVRCSRSAPPLR